MNPADQIACDKIAAAILKLAGLKADSTPAPWNRFKDGILVGVSGAGGLVGVADSGEIRVPDIDLIVTLHRTIDVQMAILRDALGASRASGYLWDYAILLAPAILGDDT